MTSDLFYSHHPKLTRSLKKFISDYQTELAPETFAAFLDHLHEELQNATRDLAQAPAGPARARLLHSFVETEIAAGANIEVSCKKGCSACCHMEVEVTNYEAAILKDLVVSGHSIDRERLKAQSQRGLQDKSWREGMRNPDNPCVFLDSEGSCGIYESRPVMCRRHSVTSPAKNCETLDATIVVRYFPKVDLWISAANEDAGLEIGPLAKMLEMQFPNE
ncbi:Flagellin N-methylase [compost metagenome]